MFEFNNLATAGKFFLVIAGELIALFIAISFLIALLQELVPPETVQRILTRQKKIVGNIIGAALGAVTPFCSCSTIPLLVGLLNSGAPFGAAMSFLIASPLLNPVIIVLFLSVLGLKITVTYALLMFIFSVLTGILWEKLGLASQYKNVMIKQSCCCEQAAAADSNEKPTWNKRFKSAGTQAWVLFRQVFPYLILGAGIGAFIYGFVPETFITEVAGKDNLFAIPIAAIVGVPMYIRVETMIPISSVLLGKGMSLGAVMALIIGGAGASIPEVTLLSSIFRIKLVLAFVITILLIAIAAGYFFDYVII